MSKYLDSEGLAYFLSKLKDNGFISSTKTINGNYTAYKFRDTKSDYSATQQIALPIFSIKVPKDVPAVIHFRTILHIAADMNCDNPESGNCRYTNVYYNSTFFKFNQIDNFVSSTQQRNGIETGVNSTNNSIINGTDCYANGPFIMKNDAETYTAIIQYKSNITDYISYSNLKKGTFFNWFSSITSTDKSIDVLEPVVSPSEFINNSSDFGNYFSSNNMTNITMHNAINEPVLMFI